MAALYTPAVAATMWAWHRDGLGALDGKTILITGGTGGIGAATARGLWEAGGTVVIACRDTARGAALVAEATQGGVDPARAIVAPLDLASLASVHGLAAWARATLPRLDVLINNAGVWSRQRRSTTDGFELSFGVNHLAHQALTVGLLPLLQKSAPARVITVASGLHLRGKLAWDDLMQSQSGFNGNKAYEQSKLANVMFAAALARRAGGGVTSNALHPGVVKTGLTREYPELARTTPASLWTSATEGAKTTLFLATSATVAGVTGRYFDREREATPSKAARVVADQERLWALSEALIGAVD
jgi:NAD(P)-dependent dehydrogenase (short-subunit alcohol dehydrogenase family)